MPTESLYILSPMGSGWTKNLAFLGIALAVLAVFGHVLPSVMRLPKGPGLPSTSALDTVPKTDSLPTLHEQLVKELPVLRVGKARGKNGRPTWTLGKGLPLPVYLLNASRIIYSRGGKVIRMVEQHGKQPSAWLDYADGKGDTVLVNFSIGEKFLDSASLASIVFTVDSLDIPILAALDQLTIPYTLLIRPTDSSANLGYDLDRLRNEEVFVWQGMEPNDYPFVNPGKGSIFIHHNAEQIRGILAADKKRLPNAVGVATYMGSRVVEHQGFMQTFLKEMKLQNLVFLDIAGSRLSQTEEVCRSVGAECIKASAEAYDANTALANALSDARKQGTGIAVLPLNQKSLGAVETAIALASEQGTNFVKLSTIIHSIP